ncbi:ABC transporter permease subunit [Rhizobium sp. NZLR5]|uniref:ABC transporter permease n=1 Tax=Rhizobium sp. NZLR5 TaxID=2731103 RepID=UPI001C82FDA1|nr:ABC transporter permease subunit [Rhizobium sp. NZLR5]MBX5182621.1 ABC transporter permease subunit [Rhizobium sp. NZLR5]
MDTGFLWETFLTLLGGLPLTLELAITSILAGSALALAISLLAVTGGAMGRTLTGAYVFIFRGSPLLVQMFLIYYGLGQFRHELQDLGVWGFFREPYWCAVLALTLNTAAYCSEIFRGGLQAVSIQEIEAARACSMSGVLLFRRIILPIAIRHALPAYGNEIILMLKATALASVITIMEVTGLAGKLNADSFRAFEIFIVAGAIYLAIIFVVTRMLMVVEFWLSPHMRMRLQS